LHGQQGGRPEGYQEKACIGRQRYQGKSILKNGLSGSGNQDARVRSISDGLIAALEYDAKADPVGLAVSWMAGSRGGAASVLISTLL
jgi:hypothetical protein